MQTLNTIEALRKVLDVVRKKEKTIALIPTMGNLHAGHLSLVEAARSKADCIVVSIFVNPTQFNNKNDLANYPRTLEADVALLEKQNIDYVFCPDVEEIYPLEETPKATVTIDELDNIHCGAFRSGHFKGVATVITKLFNIVRPDIALFGEKDYQQLLIIQHLASSLNLPIKIIGLPTIRETNGLAMSSRNQHLSAEEKEQAALLFKTLNETADKIVNGEKNYTAMETEAVNKLNNAGFETEYFTICDADSLKMPTGGNLIILTAVKLGAARLIDNVAVHTYA